MKQRGFAIEGWMIQMAVGALVVAAIVTAGAIYLHHRDAENFKAGQADVQAKWDRQKLADVELARMTSVEVGRALLLAEKGRMAAEAEAQKHRDKFEEGKREARRLGVALAGCTIEGQDPAPSSATGAVAGINPGPGIRAPGVAGGAASVRLTWEFVREFDGGWTGLDGKPVSPLVAGGAGAGPAGAFAPYRLEDAVDVAGVNAERCSRDRRELDTLTRKIQAAGAAWDSTHQSRETR